DAQSLRSDPNSEVLRVAALPGNFVIGAGMAGNISSIFASVGAGRLPGWVGVAGIIGTSFSGGLAAITAGSDGAWPGTMPSGFSAIGAMGSARSWITR